MAVSYLREGEGQIFHRLYLKELSHDILSYFGLVQSYVYIEGNLKITVY